MITNNHVIIHGTLIHSCGAHTYTYCYKCVRVQVFYIQYIVHFPTSPSPALVWRGTHNVMANWGPQSDVQVFCGVVVSDAADVGVEQMSPGRGMYSWFTW